jgi:aromatic-L-amino-acid/L-tryptophan decarboxylase
MKQAERETRGRMSESLEALEAESRNLDTDGSTLSEWLAELDRFSRSYLAGNSGGPAFLPLGRPRSDEPVPLRPAPLPQVLSEFEDTALTRGIVPTSGRFFGYIPGGAVPSAAVGDYLAALTNRYSGVYAASPGAAEIENSAVRWLTAMIGYPESAWGTLQSGGSLATLVAIIAARETRAPTEWSRGVIYLTEECHLAIRKAVHMAGLAQTHLRIVPVDARLRMSADDLARLVAEDRRKGLQPWVVVASAGTVNTGAVDPLADIAEIAAREGLWYHIDAAYGGFFVLTERAREKLAALSQADSVVLDPHKGLFLPYGCGAILARDGERLRKAFEFTSSYLKDVHHEAPSPTDYSPELTRHFRALRLWMSLKLHGLERFRAALSEKLVLAEMAQERLAAMTGLEVGPEPDLSIVAFRVRPDGRDGAGGDGRGDDGRGGDDDAATQAVLDRIVARGRVHLSSTRLWGKLYIRICVLCFRSHRSDLEEAFGEIERALTVR